MPVTVTKAFPSIRHEGELHPTHFQPGDELEDGSYPADVALRNGWGERVKSETDAAAEKEAAAKEAAEKEAAEKEAAEKAAAEAEANSAPANKAARRAPSTK